MSDEAPLVNNITVFGGGDAGLLSALLLNSYSPELDVRVIDDGTPQTKIGKSTFKSFVSLLHDTLNIPPERFYAEAKPVWKISVYFEDWCGNDPFHVPFTNYVKNSPDSSRQFAQECYHRYENDLPLCDPLVDVFAQNNLSPFFNIDSKGNQERFQHHAYHLNIHEFNDFLRTLCDERGISIINDAIADVETDGETITQVISETDSYTADFFVDATGANRMLIGELDTEFESFGTLLDSAIVTQQPLDFEDIVGATVLNSGDNGWLWQIDTVGERDIAYVYASDYTSDADALTEFNEHHDTEYTADDVDTYRFSAGFYPEPCVGNCFAVGNAHGFIEPIQSLSLSTSAMISDRFAKRLSEHRHRNTPAFRKYLNEKSAEDWRANYDFVLLHYLFQDEDTEFWNDMRELPRPDRLQNHIKTFRESGLPGYSMCEDAITGASESWLHYLVFYATGVECEFYENNDITVNQDVIDRLEQRDEDRTQFARDHLPYNQQVVSSVYQMGKGKTTTPF
jgi:tryptophan halogenase